MIKKHPPKPGQTPPKKGRIKAVHRRLLFLAMLLCVFLVIFVIALSVIIPTRYNLHVGDIAKVTITASKDVVDEVTTEQRRDQASAQVQASYRRDEAVDAKVLSLLEKALDELAAVQAYGVSLREKQAAVMSDVSALGGAEAHEYTAVELEEAGKLLTTVSLSKLQMTTLLNLSSSEMEALRQNLLSAVRTTLNGTIPEDKVSDAITNIQQLMVFDMGNDLWWNVAVPTLRACLMPNMVIDQETTEENRAKAREEVEQVIFKQGQNIVIAGERVTAAQIAMLNALGLLEGTQFDVWLYVGIAMVSALVLLFFVLYLVLFARDVLRDLKQQALLLVILLLTLMLSRLFTLADAYAIPTALGVLLAKVLLGTPVAMGLNIIQSLLMGMLSLRISGTVTGQAFGVILISMIGGVVGIYFLRRRVQRSAVLAAGLYVGVVNFLSCMAVGLITNHDFSQVIHHSLYSMGGGVLSAVLCVGLQPALEAMFNLVTPSKLLELCNPNNPLLRRLMLEAPGTYHHSMIVANIGEAAAEAVDANPLLVRVGAYFHDIGKLKRPMYFKENQIGENPHDHTDPFVSKDILCAHVTDGLDLGQKHRLPPPVMEIIGQHHGDTPVAYFYHKAKQMNPGQDVDVEEFRYAGPKPQSAEAAIVMLADTVEAAIRSMPNLTPVEVEAQIKKLIRGKVEDGQMENAPLTFRDLSKIADAFVQMLGGVFHERIEYPDVSLGKRKQKQSSVQAPRVIVEREEKPEPEAGEQPKASGDSEDAAT